MRPRPLTLCALLILAACTGAPELPGPRADGSTLLPNGWSLRPHGRQIPLDSDLPVRSVLHPSGRALAVQHAGYREHGIVLLDTDSGDVVARVPLDKTWSGMCFSPDGRVLYASGGVEDCLHIFDVDPWNWSVEARAKLALGDGGRLDLPAGMCTDDEGRVYVALQRADRVVRLSADGRPESSVALEDGSYPFECAVHRGKLYVSLWGKRAVRVFDCETSAPVATIPCGEHPSEMLVDARHERLFVSNAGENSVDVIDLRTHRVQEAIRSSLYAQAAPGSTPNALALAPNGKVLLVANADNNNLAVVDVSERGESRGLGFIPVGLYPSSVRWHASGTVLVCNGKGSAGSRANPAGPSPIPGRPRVLEDYTGAMFRGSLSVFPFPQPRELQALSKAAYACSPLRDKSAVRAATRPDDSPIPARVGDPSPIRHCVYIIKENRTYDQVLGDDPRGNGDPELCLFPEAVTPNHHAIARDFVLLDNFYVEAEVSADGHEWTMGAYATDFVERTWPVVYGGKGTAESEGGASVALGYPSEGKFEIAFPKSRYLWDRAKAAGVSYRSYGEFVANGRTPDAPGTARTATLEGHFDPFYRSYDLDYRDVDRAKRFLRELAGFEARGELPRLIVIRLPNDHTSGTRVGKPTPRAMVADNDLALGMVLEGLSKSSFWKSMAIFVVEDDAQNGPDHVDAHRSVGLVVSPYVRRGAVVSTMYSTCSMLRTIELILGLEPMSQFDAAARPMYDLFQREPDLRPYACRPATWSLDAVNDETAWGAARSAELDLSREDAADDLVLGEIVWKAIRGAESPMPMPRRAAFVRVVERD